MKDNVDFSTRAFELKATDIRPEMDYYVRHGSQKVRTATNGRRNRREDIGEDADVGTDGNDRGEGFPMVGFPYVDAFQGELKPDGILAQILWEQNGRGLKRLADRDGVFAALDEEVLEETSRS